MTFVKPQARLLGFDDGPFTFQDETASLAGVMTRGAGYVEAVLTGEVQVDGEDATQRVIDLVQGSGFEDTALALVVNGGSFGGFNVIDLDALHRALGLPVAAVLRDPPDHGAVAEALEAHFEDAEDRLAVLTAQPVETVDLGTGTAHVRRVGMPLDELELLLRHHTVRGRTPEPLRIAHLVATALAEGRSRGA